MEKKELLLIATEIMLLTLLPSNPLTFDTREVKAETQTIPPIEDLTPGYWETSEYMIGSVAVGIILPESNGTIDPNTEDWTDEEIENVTREINYTLNWWASQNPNASVKFIEEIHLRVPTSYEPINRPETETYLWISEVMDYLGYENVDYSYQVRDYVNNLRDSLGTNWAFVIFIVDSGNDSDGYFAGGGCAAGVMGGPFLSMTYDNGKQYIGIENMDWVCAVEMAHCFWADDEYFDNPTYSGYLNVSNVPHSGCLMDRFDRAHWCLSGASHGLTGTWGQVGWRDTDGDGIQDIVDTFPRVFINTPEITRERVNVSGTAAVTPYPNRSPSGSQRNVTINKIKSVQFRIDEEEWLNATIIPTTIQKLMRYPDTYVEKETYAIVNYTFVTPELEPGEHFIEVKTVNSVGNEGFANETVTIPEPTHDISIKTITPYRIVIGNNTSTTINVTAENIGDYPETFNVTLYYNTTQIGTQEVTLTTGQSTLTFNWTTPSMLGNYTLTAVASQVPGETEIEDNTLTYYPIQVSIAGDINADGTVNIIDISKAAVAFQTNPGDPKWNSNADVNEDSVINIVDISKIAIEYGKTA